MNNEERISRYKKNKHGRHGKVLESSMIMLFLFMSVLEHVVIHVDCQSSDNTANCAPDVAADDPGGEEGRNSRDKSQNDILKELLADIKSELRALRADVQLQKENVKLLNDQQQLQREMFANLTKSVKDVTEQAIDANRHSHKLTSQLLNQSLSLSDNQLNLERLLMGECQFSRKSAGIQVNTTLCPTGILQRLYMSCQHMTELSEQWLKHETAALQSTADDRNATRELAATVKLKTTAIMTLIERQNLNIQQAGRTLEAVESILQKMNGTDQRKAPNGGFMRDGVQESNSIVTRLHSSENHSKSRRKTLASVHCDDARTLSRGGDIRGLAVMNDELYVARENQSVIEVYDVATLTHRRNLSISGLRCVTDLASCPQCNVVYLSNSCQNKIYAVDERGYGFNWSVAESPESLSVNSRLYVIVTYRHSRKLQVFTSQGRAVRNVSLQASMQYPWQAVQVDDDLYAVAHGEWSDGLHRVCIVDGHGTILQSYGGNEGPDIGQLNEPLRMLTFGGSMIVVDHFNYRLLLFNVSPLTYKREVISTLSESLEPYRAAISEDGTRLFVSYWHRLRTFNLTWN